MVRASFAVAVVVLVASPAGAQVRSFAPQDAPEPSDRRPPARDARDEVPRVAFAESAFGSPAGSLGVAAVGGARGERAGAPLFLGGAMIFGAPVDRVTLLATTERRANDRYAPSGTVFVRFLGDRERGFALGALARYKLEGFDEAGGEVEGGVAASYARGRTHLDANAVAGGGLEESEEVDAEVKLRAGWDVVGPLRLGVDGQLRKRVAGGATLAGGRTWDVVAGGQAQIGLGRFFAAATAGPSTVQVADGLGWTGLVTVGGVAL
jgi:hypothetical protein